MTELEKSKRGDYEAIDLNKLAEEIRQNNREYIEEHAKAATQGLDAFMKISINSHMKPAENMMFALVAFLMKTDIPEPLIAHYAGAFSAMSSILLNMTDNTEKHKYGAKLFEEYLMATITAVHMRVPNNTGKGDKK